MKIYESLLKEWCDALLEFQITEIKFPGVYGGIMCPACSRIHGRCGDGIYPLMHMAQRTGEKKYLEAAISLQAWTEQVSCPDGSWVNEQENLWNGITVFGAIALGEALKNHGHLLEKPVHEKWMNRFRQAINFIFDNFDISTGNINYPITACYALTLAGKVLGEERFLQKGREFAKEVRAYFTDKKLIFGEGHPQDGYTQRGCRAVDLGYNVEESLPALVLYGRLAKDEEMLELLTESLREHLEFMLPDGAWDNSWGSRSFKWTYWGSRTSDGCQTAYALMADRDPIFALAAQRNTLLMKSCTHNGLLYGGPHYHSKGELPCIQHTFCHAKALTTVQDHLQPNATTVLSYVLPREVSEGVKEYPEISTWLIAIGPWRSTVTAYDWEYLKDGHPSGGALSLLWHKEIGTVFVASMTEYQQYEGSNLQRNKERISIALTPRLELYQQGKYYRSINDYNAKVEYNSSATEVQLIVTGKLVDNEQNDTINGEVSFCLNYIYKENSFRILVEVNGEVQKDDLRYYLPIVSDNSEEIIFENSECVSIHKQKHKLQVTASSVLNKLECDNNRIFNLIPGFEAVPFYLDLNYTKKADFTVTIMDRI